MRPSLLWIATLGLGLIAAACNHSEPATFVSLEVWEGELVNAGLPLLKRRVEPMVDGSLELRRNTPYVARVTVRTSETAGRCLFDPFSYSWALPSRDYICYPEVGDGPMTIDVPFATWEGDLARTSDYNVTVRVVENGLARQPIATGDTRRYAVRFSD